MIIIIWIWGIIYIGDILDAPIPIDDILQHYENPEPTAALPPAPPVYVGEDLYRMYRNAVRTNQVPNGIQRRNEVKEGILIYYRNDDDGHPWHCSECQAFLDVQALILKIQHVVGLPYTKSSMSQVPGTHNRNKKL